MTMFDPNLQTALVALGMLCALLVAFRIGVRYGIAKMIKDKLEAEDEKHES